MVLTFPFHSWQLLQTMIAINSYFWVEPNHSTVSSLFHPKSRVERLVTLMWQSKLHWATSLVARDVCYALLGWDELGSRGVRAGSVKFSLHFIMCKLGTNSLMEVLCTCQFHMMLIFVCVYRDNTFSLTIFFSCLLIPQWKEINPQQSLPVMCVCVDVVAALGSGCWLLMYTWSKNWYAQWQFKYLIILMKFTKDTCIDFSLCNDFLSRMQ